MQNRATTRAKSEKTPLWLGLASVALPFIHGIAKLSIRGKENVPASGPFILAPNHYSEIDPLIMGVAMYHCGRMPRFLAKASLFKVPVVGGILRASGQVPVERSGSTRTADPLAGAADLIAKGYSVIVYPEGSLTRDPNLWPMRGKLGAVKAALAHDIPIVPAAHWGTQHVMPRYGKRISLFPRKRIDIAFGEPVDLSEFAGRSSDAAALAVATDRVMARIAALLGELRGETPPAERWDPAKNDQTETGRF